METDSDLPFWKKKRYLIAFLAFWGFYNVYALRVNLSVAIVAMTELHNVTLGNGTVVEQSYFDWNSKEQGLILSSFFYGYIWTQILGGVIANKLGGNIVYGVGIGATAALTLLTPLAANAGIHWLVAIRIVEGLFEGVTFPSMLAVWSKWAPVNERSRLVGSAFSGAYFGIIIGMPLSGMFATNLGWESVFYGTGAIGCVWCAVWLVFVKETPDKDPGCLPAERAYIKSSLGDDLCSGQKIRHPWKEIAKSKPVWAITAAHFAENWGFYTLLTQLPMFLKDTLNFNLQKSGFVSGLPYITLVIVLLVAGFLADWTQIKGYLTTTQVRRYFNTIGFTFQVIFMMLTAYLLHPTWSIVYLSISVGVGGFAYIGFGFNHLDIAPIHASVLMGITNTFASLPGIISPLLTGYIVQNKSAEEWKIVFYIASGIFLVNGFIFWCWCSGKKQPWAVESLALYHSKKELKNRVTEIENID